MRILIAMLVVALLAHTTCWAAADVKVASFNIRDFGQTKAKKAAVMRTIANTMRKFDVIAVEEVSDIQEKAPKVLRDKLNANGRHYDFLLSKRTGEQANDRTTQEQYAIYFDTETVEALDQGALFGDRADDFFQREPFTAHFKVKGSQFTFTVTAIHTQPTQAIAEIDALFDVYKDVKSRYPGEKNHMIVGDYNASCTYAKPTDLAGLRIHGPNFAWIVPNDVDTTVSPTTHCAYDRIVLTKELNQHFSAWGIANWFTSMTVSDHWPVWVKLKSAAP